MIQQFAMSEVVAIISITPQTAAVRSYQSLLDFSSFPQPGKRTDKQPKGGAPPRLGDCRGCRDLERSASHGDALAVATLAISSPNNGWRVAVHPYEGGATCNVCRLLHVRCMQRGSATQVQRFPVNPLATRTILEPLLAPKEVVSLGELFRVALVPFLPDKNATVT